MEKTNEQKNDIRQHGNVNPAAVSMSALHGMQEVQYLMPDVFRQEKPPDNRPFLCNICGNRFRQQCHLTQHIRIHTNDRPYQCSHCDKAFKQKSQLNQHERIHTGEKPYQCHLCEKAFPQAGQLYSHKKTHGINPNVNKRQPNPYGEQNGIPKRGRKRKVKTEVSSNNPVVLSPPPVAYLIESLHRSPPPQYEHSRANKLPSTSTLISSSTSAAAAVAAAAAAANNMKVQHVMTKEGTIYTVPSTSSSGAELKFIPPPISREHHYLQSQIYYQQLQQQQQFLQQQQQQQHQQQQQQQHQQQQQQQQQSRQQELKDVKQEPLSPQIPHADVSMVMRTSQENPVSTAVVNHHSFVSANHSYASAEKLAERAHAMNPVPSHLKDLVRLIPSCDTT